MARSKQQDVWEFFGELLKEHREAAGLSQGELGRRVFVSGAYIGLFEQGIRKPQLDVAKRIDEVLQTGGIFERTWRKLINKSPYASYFQAAAELEDMATKICEFESTAIPGLLQTPAYARAVVHASNPLATDDYVEETVKGRLDRSAILRDATRPMYWVILHEAVLRIPVGGPAVMAEQLDHLVVQARNRVALIQVLPFAAGAYPQMGKPLKLMEFEDAPPTAYTEAVYSGNLLDDPAVVKRAQATYDLLRAAALSPEVPLTLIESAAEDHRRCTPTT
ncbi:helix-turn-helix domain-containing protein [Streptomyces nymphaeiformis]|uniref:Transcriptional regulator with XRE-family HTH domain n=1 Tax=Streptomyces nymphaeiformis TaxID=2663842 RepID=A0A7W7TUG2_9ACTN|nr:helix-turn-helix transcriptional regulator [Streptomyces nymphaeiformis]MBB4979567.1 transcriptional regulator with XRE-family HTH domain [Streptomyces nymphaeiformis]